MHIPDGFLDVRTAAATAALAAAGVTIALRAARATLPPRRVPLLGLGAAFVFAAQMLNFPVLGGTSGHLAGGVLAAVLLGPGGAVLVLTAVLLVQCLMFADGGLLALGANVFNLGIVGGAGGGCVYRAVHRVLRGDRGRLAAAAFAAWVSVVLAAVFAAAELALSGTVAWPVAVAAMAQTHMLVGIGEALVTALVLVAIMRARPELLEETPVPGGEPRLGEALAYGLLVSLGLAVLVAPFASGWPDGLEWVAETLGFLERAALPLLPAPIPGYEVPGFASAGIATALAGAVGTVLAFALACLLARLLVPRRGETRSAPSGR